MNNFNWISGDDPGYSVSFNGDSGSYEGNPYSGMSWDRFATNPEFRRLLGITDPLYDPFTSTGSGDSGGNYGLDQSFLNKISQAGWEQKVLPVQGGEIFSVFKNGKEVSPSLRNIDPYYEGADWELGTTLASMALAPGGFLGGAESGIGAGLGGAAAQGANAAFNSGLISAGSGAKDKDVAKGMFLSGGAPFLPNLGEFVGIDNPYLANAFDGAVKGAGIADLMDGDVKTGAITGGLPGLASYTGARFGDTSYVPTSSGQNLINETNQMSGIKRPGFSFTEAAPMTPIPQYVPQASPLAYNAPEKSSGFELPDLNNFFSKLTPSSPEQWGSLAEGLSGLFMGGMQYRKARKLEKEMGNRRGAYETNLRRQLERRDAASGRRSNYSGRETALQASLAELDSRNMPAMASLNNSQMAGLGQMFTSGLRYAGKSGVFGDRFTPGYREAPPPSSYMLSTIPMTTDVNNFDQFIGGARFGDQNQRRFRLGGMGS